ncbi:metallopeptidase family M24 [Plectosphaerella plurivora]|uniref:Probable Xaa-Pro aminopeptidase P n=1 Tax=Plectosphaerella plurivora TaxID=936078 RepID=A0A9P8V3X8_9PEZI|nr:metallopeptidase family M24 [Plectosphaerella plurivora]
MERVNTTDRLAKLRELMRSLKVDVYVIPSEDAHSSEYIAACDARREYISGFTGSAGCAVVTLEKAALATDGRYFNQASKQLDENWLLLKQGLQDVPTWQDWSVEQASGGKSVAVDPELLAGSAAKRLDSKIKKSGGSGLVAIKQNLVDSVWGKERPSRPMNSVTVHLDKYAGKGVSAKLAELRQELEKKNASGMVVSMLDEVAWLFNLRGSDIPYNPVFFSYALVTPESATLFVHGSKLGAETLSHLSANGVSVKSYDAIYEAAGSLRVESTPRAESVQRENKMLISSKTSWALKEALGGDEAVEEVRSPVGDAKAVKNETEMAGMRACHIRDGAALIEYLAWLEHQLIDKKAALDEVEAADKLEELRSKREHYVGLSFDTISSTGANAAIIHYKPERGSCPKIDPNAIYLCDSGAQYRDGTTDVTRTVHFGQPTDAERIAYTLVLKGHIALDDAVFPKSTTGFALDCLARQFLWREGLDYRHGTGHGVGSFLNVHEGPIGIGTRVQYAEVALAPGNVVSIEPGFYEDGAFGIRIENLAMVTEVKTKHSFGDKPYLGFEHVTMVPYCRKLIQPSLLTDSEKSWINNHHADILQKTRDMIQSDPIALSWLVRETQPL